MKPFNIITQTEPQNTKRYKWASAILAFNGARKSWKQRLDRGAEKMANIAPTPHFGLMGRCKRPPLWKVFTKNSFILLP